MPNLNFPALLLLLLLHNVTGILGSCRTSCSSIAINYPFGIDDGCGAPQFRHMLNCSGSSELFFVTPSGSYKVESIDYTKQSLTIFDPAMSTCSILQPHHDFLMTEIQTAVIPPSSDTVFVLVNCSVDSPLLNHYSSLCFNFAGHSCDEMYGACNSFKLFHLLAGGTSAANTTNATITVGSSPPCCFTGYDTVRYMSMNILDCTHYTSVYNTDELKGVGPVDWLYGMKLSYAAPDTGCERCRKSGGMCGFDVETQGFNCICNMAVNATRECAPGTGSVASGEVRGTAVCLMFQLLLMNVALLLNSALLM